MTLKEVEAPLTTRCNFLIRGKRQCKRFASIGSSVCSLHTETALKAQREATKESFLKKAQEETARLANSKLNDDGVSNGTRPKRKSRRAKVQISSSQKRMANPFSFQEATPPPNWAEVYADPSRPLYVDVGCAKGRHLQTIAAMDNTNKYNYLGLEIRPPLVQMANEWRDKNGLKNLHFIACNFSTSLNSLFGSGIPQVAKLCFQFPDPWKRNCHHRRRIIQPELVERLATVLYSGAEVYLVSDRYELANEMRRCFEDHPLFCRWTPPVPQDQKGLLLTEHPKTKARNPLISATSKMIMVFTCTIAFECEEFILFWGIIAVTGIYCLIKYLICSSPLKSSEKMIGSHKSDPFLKRDHLPTSFDPSEEIDFEQMKWLAFNPLCTPTERDLVCESIGRIPFRCVFKRK